MVRAIRVFLPLFVCSAIAASPAVSRQQRIAPPSLEVEIRNDQMSPALASRGADAFAVWTDSRVSGYGALFGSRIAADGTILDPFGILIDKSIGANPAVAWNGTDYLAVASQPEPNVASIDPLYAWQLTTDGKVRPSKTFVGRIRDPRLASNGRTIAIGGSQHDGGFFGFLDDTGRLHGTTRVSHVVGANVIPVADANDWFAFFDKPRCVNCPFTVHQLRVTNGSVISEKPLFEASAPRTLNAATDGRGRFAITWARLDPTATFEVYTLSVHYAIVDRDGTVLKAPTLLERSPVTFAPGAIRGGNMSVAERPAIVWDGNQFVVAWRWFDGAGNNGTRVARIAADGATAEIEPTPTSPYTSHYYTLGWSAPVMVKTDTSLLLQWPRLEPRGTSRVARLVQHAAPLGTRMHNTAPVPLSVPPLAQLGVALAGGDGGMLAVWQEDRTPAPVLKARLFPHHGTRTAEMVVSTGRYAYSPAILWGGGVYLVVWREDEFKANRDPRIGHILARRYDGSGTPIDAAPITLASEHYTNRYLPYQTIGLAFDGQQFLAVWGAVNDRGVHGSRIPPAGPPRDHPPLVIAVSASPAPRAGAPQAIWNGRQFLVIWYEDPIPDSNGSAGLPRLPHYARTTLVGTDGKVVDRSFPAIVTTPQGFEFVRSGFEAASNGREVMVTWAYVYNNFAPFRGCAYAQRFTLEGKPLDSAPAEVLCQPAAAFFSRAGAPRVIWHQEQWWLVYSVILPEGGVFAAPLSDRRVLGPPVRLSAQPGLDGIASTALGLAAGFVQLDPAYGNVYGVFFSRMGSGRARSVRH